MLNDDQQGIENALNISAKELADISKEYSDAMADAERRVRLAERDILSALNNLAVRQKKDEIDDL